MRNGLRMIATQLLQAAGGDVSKQAQYFMVLCGGDDDIYGMTVSEVQLLHWRELGEVGKLAYLALVKHADDQSRAYGSFCYSHQVIADILNKMDSPLDRGKAA